MERTKANSVELGGRTTDAPTSARIPRQKPASASHDVQSGPVFAENRGDVRKGWRQAVDFRALNPGAILSFYTRNSCYRLVVLDPVTGKARVTGGENFPEPTEVRVDGATGEGGTLRTMWIGLGMRLELTDVDRRITTSAIREIVLESPDATI